jgi:plastocyanin
MQRLRFLTLLTVGLLVVAACGTASPSAAPGGNAAATVTITDAASPGFFDPATVTIKVGQAVQFINQSSGPHSVQWQAGGFATSAPFNKGGAPYITPVFTTAGTFPYICGIHGAVMSGKVVVQP